MEDLDDFKFNEKRLSSTTEEFLKKHRHKCDADNEVEKITELLRRSLTPPSRNSNKNPPHPPLQLSHQHLSGQGPAQSISMPINNALTNVPSLRTSLIEPNVYSNSISIINNNNNSGGGRNIFQNRIRHSISKGGSRKSNNNLRKFNNNTPGGSVPSMTLLSQLDSSILSNFGDWRNLEDDSDSDEDENDFEAKTMAGNGKLKLGQPHRAGKKSKMKSKNNKFKNNLKSFNNNIGGGENSSNNSFTHLPAIYKQYSSVVKSGRIKLRLDNLDGDGDFNNSSSNSNSNNWTNTSVTPSSLTAVNNFNKRSKQFKARFPLAKDNENPNSILSEAKRTLFNIGQNGLKSTTPPSGFVSD